MKDQYDYRNDHFTTNRLIEDVILLQSKKREGKQLTVRVDKYKGTKNMEI